VPFFIVRHVGGRAFLEVLPLFRERPRLIRDLAALDDALPRMLAAVSARDLGVGAGSRLVILQIDICTEEERVLVFDKADPLYSAMARIDPGYMLAAATLGASPVRAFLRVYLPLTLPGLMTGATPVFISTLGYYIIPALLGGAQIDRQ
jgi:hypothetical protein